MSDSRRIAQADLAALEIVRYPDPRLMEACTSLAREEINDSLCALVERMFELMIPARGVGLAAPQVGIAARLFVASPTMKNDDRHVYVNPRIISADGWQDGDEGCLSFPGISCKIKRRAEVTIEALDLGGRPFQETARDLLARIFQHEIDHLDGKLLVDRMGTIARMGHRTALQQLEEDFQRAAAR
ncbi:MAG TPA: peptide deformylase [Phycisphaerae bacterium]|nr:peptide deformylase [Phycisphaerae bacterium]